MRNIIEARWNATTPPPGVTPAQWKILYNLPTGCYPDLIDGVKNSYNYHPHLSAGIAICILFAFALLGHSVQYVRFRRWTSLLLALGALSKYFDSKYQPANTNTNKNLQRNSSDGPDVHGQLNVLTITLPSSRKSQLSSSLPPSLQLVCTLLLAS
jgi:hypothetical protein